jgi:hypothetical protein
MSKRRTPLILGLLAILGGACGITKSAPHSARYFLLDVHLVVDQKPVSLAYHWSCHQELQGEGEDLFLIPLPASGKFVRVWTSPDSQLLRAKLDANTYVVLQSPGEEWCDQDFTGQRPLKDPRVEVVSTSPLARIGWEDFDADHDHTEDHKVTIESAVVTRLKRSAADSPSQGEGFVQAVNGLPIAYQSVTGSIYPSSVVTWWSPMIVQYFQNTKGITLATPTTHKERQSRGWEDRRFFDVDQSGGSQVILARDGRYQLSLTKSAQDGMWHLPPEPVDHHAGTQHFIMPYRFDAVTKQMGVMMYECPPVTVDYHGTPLEVRVVQQLFDADRQLLVTFVNHCDSIPWPSHMR